MNRATSLAVASLLLRFATGAAIAGESPYTGPGSKPSTTPAAPAAPPTYAYFCTAQSIDRTSWYITNAISPEPQTGRYDPKYVGQASLAWTKYLDAKLDWRYEP